MAEQFLMYVRAVHKHGDEDKQPCDACAKPISVRYEVQTLDGSVLLLCKSDFDRQLKLAAHSRRRGDLDAATANGTSRIS